jgi:hypothetical protein
MQASGSQLALASSPSKAVLVHSAAACRALAAAYSLGALSTQEIEPEALVSYNRPDRSAIYSITGVRVTR